MDREIYKMHNSCIVAKLKACEGHAKSSLVLWDALIMMDMH